MKTMNKAKLNLEKRTITRLTGLQIIGGNNVLHVQEGKMQLDTSCETGELTNC